MKSSALHRTAFAGVGAWNRYWFAPAQAHSLCLLRIFFGSVLLLRLCLRGSIWDFPWIIMVPKQLTTVGSQAFFKSAFPSESLLDRWHLPYPWLEWLPMPSALWHDRFAELLVILTVLLVLGLWKRWVAPATALLFTYFFFLSQWNYYHHTLLFMIVLWILAFSPCARHYSLDALLSMRNRSLKPATVLPLRLIQFLICCIYFFTFVWKSNHGWWSGDIMRIFHERGSMRGPWAEWMLSFSSYQMMGIGTLVVEALLPFGLMFRATRTFAILVGVLLHLTIDLTMQVNTYSYQMMVLYIAFIHPASGATVVLYDKQCPLCQRSRYVARLLDWLQRTSWIDFRDPRVSQYLPFLSTEALDRQMHVIRPDGKILAAFAGWRHLLTRFSLTFVPAMCLLYLPPMNWIGATVYQWVADRRRKKVCPVMSPENESPLWETTLQNAQQQHAAQK